MSDENISSQVENPLVSLLGNSGKAQSAITVMTRHAQNTTNWQIRIVLLIEAAKRNADMWEKNKKLGGQFNGVREAKELESLAIQLRETATVVRKRLGESMELSCDYIENRFPEKQVTEVDSEVDGEVKRILAQSSPIKPDFPSLVQIQPSDPKQGDWAEQQVSQKRRFFLHEWMIYAAERCDELAASVKNNRYIPARPNAENVRVHQFVRYLSDGFNEEFGQVLHGTLATVTNLVLQLDGSNEIDDKAVTDILRSSTTTPRSSRQK